MSDAFEHGSTFQQGEVSGNVRLERFEAHYGELFAKQVSVPTNLWKPMRVDEKGIELTSAAQPRRRVHEPRAKRVCFYNPKLTFA